MPSVVRAKRCPFRHAWSLGMVRRSTLLTVSLLRWVSTMHIHTLASFCPTTLTTPLHWYQRAPHDDRPVLALCECMTLVLLIPRCYAGERSRRFVLPHPCAQGRPPL